MTPTEPEPRFRTIGHGSLYHRIIVSLIYISLLFLAVPSTGVLLFALATALYFNQTLIDLRTVTIDDEQLTITRMFNLNNYEYTYQLKDIATAEIYRRSQDKDFNPQLGGGLLNMPSNHRRLLLTMKDGKVEREDLFAMVRSDRRKLLNAINEAIAAHQ